MDKIMAEGIRIVQGLYKSGVINARRLEFWPGPLVVYEAKSSIEQELYVMFMEYRMRAFQGAFHFNPDYMHWYGGGTIRGVVAENQGRSRQPAWLRGKNLFSVTGEIRIPVSSGEHGVRRDNICTGYRASPRR